MPVTAMLKMLSSCSEYICARWKALILPCGDSMNTRTPVLAAHRVLGRRAGVARGGAEDVDGLAALREHVLEQVAEQLHRHVLEGERGPVGQLEQAEHALASQPVHRGDVARPVARAHMAIDLGGVGLVADRLEVGGGDVGDEPGQDRERQLGIGQARARRRARRASPADRSRAGRGRRRGRGRRAGCRRTPDWRAGRRGRGWRDTSRGQSFRVTWSARAVRREAGILTNSADEFGGRMCAEQATGSPMAAAATADASRTASAHPRWASRLSMPHVHGAAHRYNGISTTNGSPP